MATIDYGFLGVEGITGDTMVKLENYGRSIVSYNLTMSNGARVERVFRPMVAGQRPHAIQVSFDELYQLSQSPGGMQLIFDNLYTDNMKVREAIGLPYNKEDLPEITYTRDDVSKIAKDGSDDEVMDMVEFGVGAGLHYIAEWLKEDLLTIDSSSRRELIGKMIHVNPDALASIAKWSAEDEQAGTLGYGDIKGLKTEQAPTGSRRRRAGTNVADGTASAVENTGTQRQRRAGK